ncbi:MAG: hypothetical protein AABX38_07590 [Candidatus Micrarchaeota archaeon]
MGFTFRPVAVPPLKPAAAPALKADFSNLKDLPLPDLKRHLTGPDKPKIVVALLTQMESIARAGTGLSYADISEPERQEGLSCATMLLINGVIAVGGRKYITEKPAELARRIRSIAMDREAKLAVLEQQAEANSDMSMKTVSNYFPEVGIPLYARESQFNPVKVTEEMFQKNRFLGFSDDNSFHAFCVVPLAEATIENFAVKLDSLSGRKTVLNIIEFASMLLSAEVISKNGWQDDSIIYELNENRKSNLV